MLELDIPGRAAYRLEYLVLDLNGTLAVDGRFPEGVLYALSRLHHSLDIWVVTADTRGIAQDLVRGLGVTLHTIPGGDEAAGKRALVAQLGSDRTVAFGNGTNDVAMLEEAVLGVCVIGPEAAAKDALLASDVAVPGVVAGLELLIHTDRLVATLRR
ncbi:MAG: HAD family hydrolase [Chloroflexota bacterium]